MRRGQALIGEILLLTRRHLVQWGWNFPYKRNREDQPSNSENTKFQTCFSCSDFSFRLTAVSIICFQSSGPSLGDLDPVFSTLSGVDCRLDKSLTLGSPKSKLEWQVLYFVHLILSHHITLHSITSHQTLSHHTPSDHITSCHITFYQITSHPVTSHPILSHHIPSYEI